MAFVKVKDGKSGRVTSVPKSALKRYLSLGYKQVGVAKTPVAPPVLPNDNDNAGNATEPNTTEPVGGDTVDNDNAGNEIPQG